MKNNKIDYVMKRAIVIAEMVDAYYQEGRHDRCKQWVWRNIICPVYPISLSTFHRYLKRVETLKKNESKKGGKN